MPRRKKETTKADQLLDELLQDYSGPEQILGEGGLLKQLTARLVERALQGELNHHLQEQAADPEAPPNCRNGYSSKTVQTEQGSLDLKVPRDRRSEFEPVLVPKGQRRVAGLDEKILALYARGNTTRDIQAQLQELYGVEISPDLVSGVTDAVLPELREWQSRPLGEIYPIVWLDALRVKIRHKGRVQNLAIYLVLGVNLEGHKELLGMWSAMEEGSRLCGDNEVRFLLKTHTRTAPGVERKRLKGKPLLRFSQAKVVGLRKVMKIRAIVHPAEEGGCWAKAPALPGCITRRGYRGRAHRQSARCHPRMVRGCQCQSAA